MTGDEAARRRGRAMWVWRPADPDELVRFAQANAVTRLFVAVPVPVPAKLGGFVRLVARAHTAGIAVDALGGDPGWIDRPAWPVEHWLIPVLRAGLFDGVHVDVEPHAHPDWYSAPAGIVERYLDVLTMLAEQCRPAKATLEADTGWWFHRIAAGDSSLDREVLRRVDAVTVLAYRNRAVGTDGTIALATPQVRAATELRRPIRVGQETNDLGDSPDDRKQTFHGHRRVRMERELRVVEHSFAASSPTYAGLAIHDHTGYSAMAP